MQGNAEALVRELTRYENIKRDYTVPVSQIDMLSEGGVIQTAGGDFWSPNDHAHGQIAGYLDIPVKYYRRMKAQRPDILARNVNGWLLDKKGSRFVRTFVENDAEKPRIMRAFLSDSYRPIDHLPVVQTLIPVLQGFEQFEVTGAQLTDTRMYLQVVFPTSRREVSVGDAVDFGITLTNSETGAGAVDVKRFARVLRCKNGMVGESIIRRVHAGGRITGDAEIFREETIAADLKAFQMRLTDILKHELSDAAFDAQVNKYRELRGVEVEKPKEVIENVTQRFKMTEDEAEEMLANLHRGNDYSGWGLVNSVTALRVENQDRQYELERIGEKLVDDLLSGLKVA
jgi:hypothetical protein